MIIRMLIIVFINLSNVLIGQVDYINDIQPILNTSCIDCHGISNTSGGLNLTTYSHLMNGSSNGPVITPYVHATSILWDRITRPETANGDMPPAGSLNGTNIDLIVQWIDEGALEIPGPSAGCMDPQAYNCADDDGLNYTFEIGDIQYVNGCNYQLSDELELEYIGGCLDGPCEGYYNPGAVTDESNCDYYQAPSEDFVNLTVLAEDSILIDWNFWVDSQAPDNANILGYQIQRCTQNCSFITGSPWPWNDTNIGISETSIIDEYEWDEGVEIKYAINVKYSNAEAYGMAIGATYITPVSCTAMGDMNGDTGWNVLDIVTLANCVLADNCETLQYGCAGDMNGDGGYNVLDIVNLANCVLSNSCGG